MAKYGGIVLDEMYAKESLVYDKHIGSLTGYSDIGKVNNLFMELEKDKKITTSRHPLARHPLAKCFLVFMITGLFIGLKFLMLIFPLQALHVLSYFQFCEKSFHI